MAMKTRRKAGGMFNRIDSDASLDYEESRFLLRG